MPQCHGNVYFLPKLQRVIRKIVFDIRVQNVTTESRLIIPFNVIGKAHTSELNFGV